MIGSLSRRLRPLTQWTNRTFCSHSTFCSGHTWGQIHFCVWGWNACKVIMRWRSILTELVLLDVAYMKCDKGCWIFSLALMHIFCCKAAKNWMESMQINIWTTSCDSLTLTLIIISGFSYSLGKAGLNFWSGTRALIWLPWLLPEGDELSALVNTSSKAENTDVLMHLNIPLWGKKFAKKFAKCIGS